MVEITASMVKELREKTGAGMMDCKKALGEAAGDIEAAVDWLRTKGLAAAAKKAGRIAAEGLVGSASAGTVGALLEVNSETDFVGRNDKFQAFVSETAGLVLTAGADVDVLKNSTYPGKGHSVAEELTQLIDTIGENMSLRRGVRLSVNDGIVATYIHSATAPGLGKIGVLVALESTGDKAALAVLGKQIAMHIAATNPMSLSVDNLDPKALERERDVLTEQARASGKPDAVIEKMIEGRIRKFYEEVVLLEQVYVIDGESRVKDVIAKTAKDIGAPVTMTAFARYALGEGIEKQESDFAAEVAAQAGVR
jgi:elongation factor Ts